VTPMIESAAPKVTYPGCPRTPIGRAVPHIDAIKRIYIYIWDYTGFPTYRRNDEKNDKGVEHWQNGGGEGGDDVAEGLDAAEDADDAESVQKS
jgi:hypothetical protein